MQVKGAKWSPWPTTGRTGRPSGKFSEGKRAGNPSGNFSEGSKGTTRDKVGKVAEMSSRCAICGEASVGLRPFYGLGSACEDCAGHHGQEAERWANYNAVLRESSS